MSIVVVSDVHLGTKESNEQTFIDFLNSFDFKQFDDFVLLGDIIDLWRRDCKNVVRETTKTLELLADIGDKTRVHYIVGNHDFYFLFMKEDLGDGFQFEVKKSIVIPSGSTNFYFTHGHELEVLCNPYHFPLDAYEAFSKRLCLAGDDTGNAADYLWNSCKSAKSWLSKLTGVPDHIDLALKSMFEPPKTRLKGKHKALNSIEELAKSNDRHSRFGIKSKEFLIYGHTHTPYIDIYNRVANTGCWGVEGEGKYSYMEIIDDEPHLRNYTKQ
ncbi:UDP-2,3-diacylglucosamine diphosphatase [Methanolobus sp. ZRKC3]|uniref:UDP-2,3-diacylglucosamine diphosphatase n=1 Tax=Methanolobus sp. ZRKC3 TaxID=3125786 RepID=UPI00324B33A3